MANVDLLELDAKMIKLRAELTAGVGDDPALIAACGEVAWWAVVREDPDAVARFDSPRESPPQLCRTALVFGMPIKLEVLAAYADSMERTGAALRLLIAHAEATHPKQMRRARRIRETAGAN